MFRHQGKLVTQDAIESSSGLIEVIWILLSTAAEVPLKATHVSFILTREKHDTLV